jgi:hypothetical protein
LERSLVRYLVYAALLKRSVEGKLYEEGFCPLVYPKGVVAECPHLHSLFKEKVCSLA